MRRNWQSDITTILEGAYPADEARELTSRVIEHLSGKSRSDVLCGRVTESEVGDWHPIVERLLRHEPIQYIVGSTDWMGLHLKVTTDTLIPRPETAELVSLVQRSLNGLAAAAAPRVLDIGTGSGCIAIALKQRCPNVDVTAMDISAAALAVARENAAANDVSIRFIEQDILTDIAFTPYDIVVSNPPYVRASDEMGENVRRYEPAAALFVPENDPLLFYRRIASLHIGQQLYFEVNEHLAGEVGKVMQEKGYTYINIYKDIYGKQRFVSGRLPA